MLLERVFSAFEIRVRKMLRKGDELIIMAADLVVFTSAIAIVFAVAGWTDTAGGLTALQLAVATSIGVSILLVGWALVLRYLHPAFLIPYIYIGGGILFLIAFYGYILPVAGSSAPAWLETASPYLLAAIFFIAYQPIRVLLFGRYHFDEAEYAANGAHPAETHHPHAPSGHAHH